MEDYEVYDGSLLVSCDRALLDYDLIQRFLASAYWSPGITLEQVRRQIEHSLPFGLYRLGGLAVGSGTEAPRPQQIGFARVVSDFTRSALVNDVFIVEDEQRQGLGQHLLRALMTHPELTGIRKWLLATRDAHGVYAKLGFEPLPNPEAYMVVKNKAAKWV